MLKKLLFILSLILYAACMSAAPVNIKNLPDSVNIASDTTALDSTIVLIPTPILADSSTVIPEWTEIEPNILFMPIIFEHQQSINCGISAPSCTYGDVEPQRFDYDRKWLDDAIADLNFKKYHINNVIVNSPDFVQYNFDQLPEPPKQYVIKSEPNKLTLSLEEISSTSPEALSVSKDVKVKHWINAFSANVQFSQAYLSSNWYQGGNSNLNLLGSFNYSIKLNTNVHPNLLFENYFSYKVSMNNAPQDSLRNYSISEDLFQFNTKFGVKAAKKWYYSATAQFKTQLFNNYVVNKHDIKAAFLSPAELNVGLGMTYNVANKPKTLTFNLSLSPLSYNLRICKDIDKVDPTSVGIDEGKHTASQIGSNIESRLTWNFNSYISWSSRLYAFTDYQYLQGDWENTFSFSINKFLSTQIYLHLRYDSSKDSDRDWKKWQFKEILSFGFSYKI